MNRKSAIFILLLALSSSLINSQPVKFPLLGTVDMEATAFHYGALRVVPGLLLATTGTYLLIDGTYKAVKPQTTWQKRLQNIARAFWGTVLSAVSLNQLDIYRLFLNKKGDICIDQGANTKTFITLLTYKGDPVMNM